MGSNKAPFPSATRELSSSGALHQESENFAWREPESKYFQLGEPCALCHDYSALPSQCTRGT